jgi:Arm DNA-binding domain
MMLDAGSRVRLHCGCHPGSYPGLTPELGKWSGRRDSNPRPPAPKRETTRFLAFFCTFRFGRNSLPVPGFEVQARCGWLRAAALKRRRGVTPVSPRNDLPLANLGKQKGMATVTLTARYLDQLRSHGKRYEVFDAIVPGLAIRVSASGRKTFTLYYRHRRRMRRVGLGRYPDVLLERARKIATQHRGRIIDGADPAGEKETEHAQDDNTVQALYELYRGRKEKVLRSWSEVRRILEKEVLPTWRHRRIADIRPRDVRELVEEKAQAAPIQGNRVLERISALFTFAVDPSP